MKIRTCRSYCITRAVPSGGQGGGHGGSSAPLRFSDVFYVAENTHKYVYKQLLPPPPPQDFEQGTAMI